MEEGERTETVEEGRGGGADESVGKKTNCSFEASWTCFCWPLVEQTASSKDFCMSSSHK